MKISLSLGQGMELQHAFSRGDWDHTYLKKACEGDILSHQALDLLRGDVELVPVKRVIDGNADAQLDKPGDSVVRHQRFGLHLWEGLKERLTILDYDRLHEDLLLDRRHLKPRFLLGRKTPNKNLRDYLLRYPHIIPKEWPYMSRPLLFWGTLFRTEDGTLCVPGMTKHHGVWESYDRRVSIETGRRFETYESPAIAFLW